MTIILSSDITYNLSGGLSNADPDNSLGGEISSHPILIERLFKNVSPDESLAGKTDYRCIYIKNNSSSATFFQSQIYISYQVTSDIMIYLGFPGGNDGTNERQTIYLTGTTPTGGYITLTYTDANDTPYSVNANWDSNGSNWADNIKNALNSINGLEDVTVTLVSAQKFEINFVGRAAKRYHKIIQVEDNLIYSGSMIISVTRNTSGGPINTTASLIDLEMTTPFNVQFSTYEENTGYYVGNLLPNEYIPVWIKRLVPVNTAGVENDGFTLRIIGSSVEV